MTEWGVVYVAFGSAWRKAAAESIASLRRHHPRVPVAVIGDGEVAGADDVRLHERAGMTHEQTSRWAKVNLDGVFAETDGKNAVPTLYIDADTEICGDLTPYILPLRDGADLVMTLSVNQGVKVMQHISAPERSATLNEVGDLLPQLQAGAFAWNHTPAMGRLFAAWRDEWSRWQGADQGALMRALARSPVKLWLLGRDFNGGTVIKHRSAGG